MAKFYSGAATAVFFVLLISSGCSPEKLKAKVPIYLSLSQLFLETDYLTEGSSHSKITTVWISVNGDASMAFELPAAPPLLLDEGSNSIRILPGITANGIDASRAIYSGFEDITFNLEYNSAEQAGDTIFLTKSERTTNYAPFRTVTLIEDFDNPGLNVEQTIASDTGITKTDDAAKVFTNPDDPTEDNGKAGVLTITETKKLAEIATVNGYQLPTGSADVYLEISYRSDISFTVGVFSQIPGQTIQEPTVVVNPKEEWNKIYINLSSEVSAHPDASEYKVFIGAIYQGTEGSVLLDNLKLVY